jgi:hypothetical protein
MEAISRRRFRLEKGITTALLIGITPPLPIQSIAYEAENPQKPTFGFLPRGSCDLAILPVCLVACRHVVQRSWLL